MANIIDQAQIIVALVEDGVTIGKPITYPEHDRTFTQARDESTARREKARLQKVRRRNFRMWRLIGGPGVAALMALAGWLSWEWVVGLLVIMLVIEVGCE